MSAVVRLQFSTGRSITSRLIRAVSHSQISHVDLVLRDGTLLGAQASRYGKVPAGVQIRPPDYDNFTRRITADLTLPNDKARAVETFCRGEIGKPYDYRGVFGFVIGFEKHRDWRDPSSWFCDELIMRAFEVAGFFARPLALPADHLTPGDALLVLSPWATLRFM